MDNTKTVTGFDALALLDEIAEKETAVSDNGQVKAEQEAFVYVPLEFELVSGWHFREWKQKHVMALYEHDGFMSEEKRNRFRRNYEVVKAAIECDCFDKPTAVQPDILLDMDMRDVEQLHNAVSANFMNVVNTPKN